MKTKKAVVLCAVFCCSAISVVGQEAREVEQLQRQLQQLQAQFEKQQQLQREQIDALKKQIETLQKRQSGVAAEQEKRKEELNRRPAGLPPEQPPLEESARWQPSDPIPLWRQGRSYADVSFNGLFAAGASTAEDIEGGTQLGAHDPNQRGFTVQNLETTFSGAVDPYLRGQASIIFQIDREGESFLEVEEAFLETLALPANLQLRAGQFFTEFGRLNPQHPHAWDFVDQPLVNGRFLGGDGLRNPGARLSWLMPTPFYSELFLAVQNSQGETAHSFRSDHKDELFLGRLHETDRVKTIGDLLFTPRYAVSFDLSETQTLLLGASAAFGPNASGRNTDTQIYGVDLFWKWKPVNHAGGFPFLSFQTEAMLRRYEAGVFDNAADDLDGSGVIDGGEQDLFGDGTVRFVPGETLTDYGFYSQLAWGFRQGWVAAVRGEYLWSDRADYEKMFGLDPDRASRWRLSPNLTWYPSEFSKVRVQYNYDDRRLFGVDHSVWLQFEFLLGAHAAHKF